MQTSAKYGLAFGEHKQSAFPFLRFMNALKVECLEGNHTSMNFNIANVRAGKGGKEE